MTKACLLFLVAIFSVACGQHSGDKKKTGSSATKPVNIPQTRVQLIPPPGFTIATAFSGLQKGENSAINIMDLPGGNFDSNARDVSKSGFEARGLTVLAYKDTSVDGYRAKYVVVTANNGAESVMETFGDTSFAVMLIGSYASNDINTRDDIKASIFSAHYDKTIRIDPTANASFTLDDSNSRFKFASATSGTFIYTIGGVKADPGNKDGSSLVVTMIPPSKELGVLEMDKLTLQTMLRQGMVNISQSNKSVGKLNGYPVSEIIFHGTISGKKMDMYQMAIGDEKKLLLIVGTVAPGSTATLTELKALAHTVKFKD